VARTNATNFSGGLQFPYATAANDIFKKEDVQVLAQAVDQHTHAPGLGHALAASAIPNGTITSAMIADGTIATADLADGSVTTAKHADASVTNAKLASDVGRANLLTNGGFENWQRGNGPFATNGGFCADRWALSIAGTDTLSVSMNAANWDVASVRSAACTFVLGSGAGQTCLLQIPIRTQDGNIAVAGKTISLSVRVKASTANAVRVAIFDGTASLNTYSAFHTGDGTYQSLTATYAVPSNNATIQVVVYFAASCTAYLDNAMLVVGSQPCDYVPMHPADDLARCLRYYEVLGETSGEISLTSYAGAASAPFDWTLPYKARKAVTPTVTKNGTWSLANASQPALNGSGVGSVVVRVTGTATGTVSAVNTAAGTNITVEANP